MSQHPGFRHGPPTARLLTGIALFAVLTPVIGLGVALLVGVSVWLLLSAKANS